MKEVGWGSLDKRTNAKTRTVKRRGSDGWRLFPCGTVSARVGRFLSRLRRLLPCFVAALGDRGLPRGARLSEVERALRARATQDPRAV